MSKYVPCIFYLLRKGYNKLCFSFHYHTPKMPVFPPRFANIPMSCAPRGKTLAQAGTYIENYP